MLHNKNKFRIGADDNAIAIVVSPERVNQNASFAGREEIAARRTLRTYAHCRTDASHRRSRSEMLRLLIVDDEPAVRKGLRMRFAPESDVVVIGEATSGEEALALVETLRPDVVLMDIELPRMDGIAATRALHTTFPRLPVIVLSIHDDKGTRTRALAAGACRFVPKRGSNGELLAAIRSAATN